MQKDQDQMETQYAINKKEQPQVVQNLQISPATTEVPFSTTTTIAPSEAGYSSSKTFSTYLIHEEIKTIKKKDHVEALRKLISNQSIGSIGKSPCSSTMSSSGLFGDSLTLLVQQLKTKVFKEYLFKTI